MIRFIYILESSFHCIEITPHVICLRGVEKYLYYHKLKFPKILRYWTNLYYIFIWTKRLFNNTEFCSLLIV